MVRARAASSAGLLVFRRDYPAARTSYEESLALHWSVDDRLAAASWASRGKPTIGRSVDIVASVVHPHDSPDDLSGHFWATLEHIDGLERSSYKIMDYQNNVMVAGLAVSPDFGG